jgi:type III secretion protein L
LEVGAARDIVRAEEFAALIELDAACETLAEARDALLADAHARAQQIVAEANAQAAQLCDNARRQYRDAAQEGYRAGSERALTDWFERLAQAENAHANLQARMRERLAGIVISAVEQIIRVEQRDLLFERALSEVDRIADGAAYLRVIVHPEDLAIAQQTFSRLSARWRELGQNFPLYVAANLDVQPGNCVCESDLGTIDASLDTQLRAMRDAVSRVLKRASAMSEPESAGRAESLEQSAARSVAAQDTAVPTGQQEQVAPDHHDKPAAAEQTAQTRDDIA